MDAKRFHAKLNAILDEPDMSLKKLSEISGVPYKTLTNMRSAESMPDRANYIKLATSLGMTVVEFDSEPIESILDISRNYRMSRMLEGMSDSQKKVACAMLESIKTVEI